MQRAAISVVRAINGATRPHEAAPGTVRGDFALETAQNIVHASDSPEAAAMELALWFSPDQLLDMLLAKKRAGDRRVWLESKGNLARI